MADDTRDEILGKDADSYSGRAKQRALKTMESVRKSTEGMMNSDLPFAGKKTVNKTPSKRPSKR
jgi:hypothetical protein